MSVPEQTAQFLTEFAACERRLYAYVRCQVQTTQDADDVYQEVSAVLWSHFHEFRPGSHFFSWACEIAERQVLAHHRHRRRMAMLLGSELLDQIAVEMEAASKSADRRFDALSECVKNLPPYSTYVLRQRYHDAKSTAQIADELKCSVSAVQKTLARVYKALYNCIEAVLSAKETN